MPFDPDPIFTPEGKLIVAGCILGLWALAGLLFAAARAFGPRITHFCDRPRRW